MEMQPVHVRLMNIVLWLVYHSEMSTRFSHCAHFNQLALITAAHDEAPELQLRAVFMSNTFTNHSHTWREPCPVFMFHT